MKIAKVNPGVRANAVGPFFLRFPKSGYASGCEFWNRRKTRTLQNSMGACFQNKTLRVQGRACRACRATVSFRHHTSLKAHLKWPPRAICVVILIPAASPGPGQHVLRIWRTCCPGFPGHQTRESNAQDRELSFQNESSRSCIEAAGSLRLAAQVSLHLGSEMKKKLRCKAQ